MWLLEASIEGFRNLTPSRLVLSPTVNVFQGGNGQGKSNLLEALNYPALGRSYRGAREDDMVAAGAAHARVAISCRTDNGDDILFECGMEKGGPGRLRIDGEPVRRRADLVGRLATVVFEPQSVQLAAGAPELRRSFADQSLSVLDQAYFRRLMNCHRALRQKTALLRDARRAGASPSRVRAEAEIWNREIAREAAALCESRAAWARELDPRAAAIYAAMDPGSACLKFVYLPSLEACRRGLVGEDLAQEILSELDYIGPHEVRRGRPLAGPHLDDFQLLLGGIGLRGYGSRGEARSAALALKLAHGELIFAQRRVRPILIFDDVFSELDKARVRRLQQECAARHQLLIATARPDDVAGWKPDGLRTWRVEGGRLEELP